MNAQKKSEIDYKQDSELELAKSLPAKTSLIIGRDSKIDRSGI